MTTTNDKPKYLELAQILRERIQSGEFKAGERLPSYAELYDEHGASTATVQRACDLLDQERLIERRHGSGIFVAAQQRSVSGNIGIAGSAGYQSMESPFYMHLMKAMHGMMETEQKHMLYLGEDWDPSAAGKLDGVLLCGLEESTTILSSMPSQLPRVSIFTVLEGVTSIGIDDYRGAQLAVRHLMDFGHRRIGCLLEKPAWEARRRLGGYRDALMKAEIEPEPSWQRLAGPVRRFGPGQPYIEWAHRYMEEWMRDGWHEAGLTALMVQNDVAAIGVIQVLQKHGIKVPEQVSVIGFDGTELCDLVSPRLTSIKVPLEQIGAKAVEILSRQISGEPSSAEVISLPVSLRRGESVARIIPDDEST